MHDEDFAPSKNEERELEENIENAGYVANRGIVQTGHANADIIVQIEEISPDPGPSKKKKKIERKEQH
ncbi:hypothetical protein C0J52_09685 [Blattella germanica]|nr:hypothetical protein C0J52_09685 [Blattella germanica]